MKQVELHAPGEIRLLEVEKPKAGSGEVLMSIARAGICGSDLHAYHGRHPYIQLPVVPGHEFSGTIIELGKGVTQFKVGQRVTVEPSLVCGTCYNCKHGRYNICNHLKVIGCQTTGAFAEYLAVPANKVLALPDTMTWEQAAMIEPLAVGVHAGRIGRIQPGEKVLVMGAGTIGLMAMEAAKILGAESVMITDLLQDRLDLAAKLGADFTINPKTQNLDDEIQKVFGPDGADVIMECVGSAVTARDAIRLARKGTRIVVAGVFEEPVPVDLGLVQDHELQLLGTLMYLNDDFPFAMDAICSGKARVEPLITHRFPLEEAAKAFAVADSRKEAIKVMLVVKD
jgi:L-iditol 2-dehydrogenase